MKLVTLNSLGGIFKINIFILSLMATACVPVTRDLEQEIAKVKAQKGAPVEPLPPMKDYEPYPYTALNLRDPFAPFAADANNESGVDNSNGISPDANRVKESLEGFPLDALDMVGTMGEGASMVALIKDPDGVVHRISVDNYMGQNEGRVTAIFEDRIDLVELIPNGTGGWMERPASIALDEG